MGEDLRQRLISHLALTQLDLASAQGLHESLDLYNLHALIDEQVARAHGLILEGLLDVHNEEQRYRVGGIPIRGRATTVELAESAFSSEGELYLFGCVLNEFIALQTPLNWFSEFSIRWNKTKRRYRWPKRLGTAPLTD
jgi:type VI secretion system protein ImpG